MSEDKGINFTREAFLNPINLGMLIIATLAAFFTSDMMLIPNLIFTFAFGIELVYLGTVPRLPRFQKSVRLKKLKHRNNEMQDQMRFQQLNETDRKRFLVLKHLGELIEENFDKMPYSTQGLLDNLRKKMEKLLSNYITLLDVNNRYERYVNEDLRDQIKEEIKEEEQVLQEISSEKLKETKQRRINILKKRLNKFSSAKEKYLICQTHLQTIEDAIRYIYEQSMTLTDPEEIGSQLDNLLEEVEDTSNIINELDHDIWPVYEGMDEYQDDQESSEYTGSDKPVEEAGQSRQSKPLDSLDEKGSEEDRHESSSKNKQMGNRLRES